MKHSTGHWFLKYSYQLQLASTERPFAIVMQVAIAAAPATALFVDNIVGQSSDGGCNGSSAASESDPADDSFVDDDSDLDEPDTRCCKNIQAFKRQQPG